MTCTGGAGGDSAITTSSHPVSLRLSTSQQVRALRDHRGPDEQDSAIRRNQWENIWLRTKRYNASGKVVSGTGGVCYLYFPARLSAGQRRVLAAIGIR